MDDIKFHFKNIKKILADEQLGGDFGEYIKKFFNANGITVEFISKDKEELKGKSDSDVCEWAKKNGYDGILTEDLGMINEALQRGLQVFQAKHSEDHMKLTLLRIYKLKSWKKTIVEED